MELSIGVSFVLRPPSEIPADESDMVEQNQAVPASENPALCFGGRRIGMPHPTYVIAEGGVNHNGDVRIAEKLIDAAKAAGADAVKFQMFSADRLVAADAPCCDYQKTHAAGTGAQREMLARLELLPDEFRSLKQNADRAQIDFLATPFGLPELDFLTSLRPPAIKIASPDIVNRPLLAAAAATGLPLIVSTGAAELAEIDAAVHLLRSRNASFALLHCVSAYPTRPSEARLGCIRALADRFHVPTGFSDHTIEDTAGALAVAAGACILEKHLTLDRNAEGPDHFFSLEPSAFARYVATARIAHAALGDGAIGPGEGELEIRRLARGRVIAAQPIRRGTRLTPQHLEVKRAGEGLTADNLDKILGRVATADIPIETPLVWSMVE